MEILNNKCQLCVVENDKIFNLRLNIDGYIFILIFEKSADKSLQIKHIVYKSEFEKSQYKICRVSFDEDNNLYFITMNTVPSSYLYQCDIKCSYKDFNCTLVFYKSDKLEESVKNNEDIFVFSADNAKELTLVDKMDAVEFEKANVGKFKEENLIENPILLKDQKEGNQNFFKKALTKVLGEISLTKGWKDHWPKRLGILCGITIIPIGIYYIYNKNQKSKDIQNNNEF